jgi:hypothetical protein
MFLHLLELSSIIAEYGLNVDLLPSRPKSNDLASSLLRSIREAHATTDREAIEYLNAGRGPSDPQQYVLAKSRLKRRLLSSILFLNLRPEKNSEQTIRFFRLQRRLAQVKVLLRFGGERNVLQEARKGYRIATHFDLTAEALEFAVILRGYYSRVGDSTKFERYAAIVTALMLRRDAELAANEAYQRFGPYYIKRVSYDERTAEILRLGIERIDALRTSVRSSTIEIISYRLRIYSFDMQARYDEVYRLATEAVAYLDTLPGIATSSDFGEFALYQLSSCIQTRDLERGRAASVAVCAYYPQGTYNWFLAQEACFVFFMSMQHYDSSRLAFAQVLGHTNYVLLPEFQQQRWRLYELYLLFATGELRNMLSKKTKRAVALRELLASANEIKGDRPGFGFSIRLIYILYLIEKGSFDELTESIESFRTFVSRYVKPSTYPRSNAFAKLIGLVERYSYNYLVVKTKASKHVAAMNEVKISHAEANENIQIFPYELIWERVLESLRKHQRVRASAAPR